MSYEPKLIIRKGDLELNIPLLENEQYSSNEDVSNIAKYLLEISKHDVIKFDDIELILCSPEFTAFNLSVREKLDELKVDYRVVI